MHAQTLNCYSCGAAVRGQAPSCEHCGARLATISCLGCFSMMFMGSKFCAQCGSPATQWTAAPAEMLCPSCQVPILQGRLKDLTLHECGKCFGLWINTPTFERICHDSGQQSTLLGQAQSVAAPQAPASIRYVPCPECHKLMHRVNFANCSGVVVDVCRQHGSWFDANELQRIVAFIRAGGLERAREQEKRQWAQERRRLDAAKRESQTRAFDLNSPSPTSDDLLTPVVRAAGELSSFWQKR